jgi:hypothetical protein
MLELRVESVRLPFDMLQRDGVFVPSTVSAMFGPDEHLVSVKRAGKGTADPTFPRPDASPDGWPPNRSSC